MENFIQAIYSNSKIYIIFFFSWIKSTLHFSTRGLMTFRHWPHCEVLQSQKNLSHVEVVTKSSISNKNITKEAKSTQNNINKTRYNLFQET